MSSATITDPQKTEILYKKYNSIVDANPGGSYYTEPPVNARPRVYPSVQIFSQNIPSVAPIDLVQDEIPVANGKKYTSAANPWIAKYEEVTLTSISPNQSFNCIVNGVNLCSNSIPFNYDAGANLSYNITVFGNKNGVTFAIGPNSTVTPWNFDPDGGCLTFFGNNNPPLPVGTVVTMTFWRYEGTIGLNGGAAITVPPNSVLYANNEGTGVLGSDMLTYDTDNNILEYGNSLQTIITEDLAGAAITVGVDIP